MHKSCGMTYHSTMHFAELELFFINDTPRLRGGESGSIAAQFSSNRNNVQIRCRLRGFEREHENCML